MKTLLRLDASARTTGSVSRTVADEYMAAWQTANPGGRVVRRDLAANPVPHIADRTIQGYYTPAEGLTPELREATKLSDELIAELMSATDLLIATPMYNFTVPSALKAWIDQIVRIHKTFSYDGKSFTGLVTGRPATLVVAYGAGGYQPGGPFAVGNFADTYLTFLLNFLGFTSVTTVPVEATTAGPDVVAASRKAAIEKIHGLFAR